MGLPGTEVALEELTCLLFGELVMQGKLAMLADDVIMGASTVSELLNIFEEVLGIMLQNNLRFSAKTSTMRRESSSSVGTCTGFNSTVVSQGHYSFPIPVHQ